MAQAWQRSLQVTAVLGVSQPSTPWTGTQQSRSSITQAGYQIHLIQNLTALTKLCDPDTHFPFGLKYWAEGHTSSQNPTSMISLTSHSDSSLSSFKCAVPTCLSLLKKDLCQRSEGVKIVRTLKRKQAQRSSLFAPCPHPERAGQDMLLEPCTPQCQRQTLKNQIIR